MNEMGMCAYHSERAAVDRCANCGASVCAECRTEAAGQSICRRCDEAIRARIASELDSSTSSSGNPASATAAAAAAPLTEAAEGFPTGPVSNTPPPVGSAASAPPGYAVAPAPLTAGRIALGIALGLIVGLVSLVVWVLLVHAIPFNLSLFAIAMGWLIGFAVVKGCGQGGTVPAAIGGVLSLLFIVPGSLLTSGAWWFIVFCVGFGVYEGYSVPRRAGGQ